MFRVEPKPGTEVEPGTDVTLFVSAGFPQLAFDNDRDVLLVSGAEGKQARADRQELAGREGPGVERRRHQRSRTPATARSSCATSRTRTPRPQPLTKEGERFRDLAWAPTADVNALAMIKSGGGTR